MADRHDIVEALESLAIHCRPPLMSVEDRARWMRDWCEDLKDFPMDAVGHACRRWRNGEDRRFPTPGQLMPMIRAVVKTGPVERAQPWTPVSDAEYAAFTIRDKIRHLQIVASEEGKKAGPMFRNGSGLKGVHLLKADMPEGWHEYQRRLVNLNAEIGRLRAIMRRPQDQLAKAEA